MEREYIYRKNKGPIRRPSRHNRPPWLLWALTALVVIAILVVILLRVLGGNGDAQGDGSSQPAAPTPIPDQASQEEPPPAEAAPTPEPAAPAPQQTAPGSAPQDAGSFMIADGVGYEYYEFSTETTNSYISAVASAGGSLAGTAQVYSMVVPTAMDVLLPESYLSEHQVNSADQRKAIDRYIYPSINAMEPGVKTVALLAALLQHCNEPIYFGTDRTWTQLGAYYAYVEFCKAKGIQAVGLDQFEKHSYEGYTGYFANQYGEESFYSDTVDAYFPPSGTSLSFTDQNGDYNEGWQVISDGEGYSSSLLNLIFTAGDQPYKVLENSGITDGSSCLVIQDSYGNFFTPFLTQHYQYVYAVDSWEYSGNALDLAREKGVSDVIILNNVIMTSSSSGVEALRNVL